MHQRTRRVASVLICAVSVLAVSACGDDEETTPTTAAASPAAVPATADDLSGRVFTSTAVEGTTIVDGSTVVITFVDDATLSANAGCNTMNGGYTVEDGVLVAANLMSTLMACEEGLMAQDTWVTTLLTSSPTVTIDGDTLTVAGDDITLTLAGA